jgi:hypothetical protein
MLVRYPPSLFDGTAHHICSSLTRNRSPHLPCCACVACFACRRTLHQRYDQSTRFRCHFLWWIPSSKRSSSQSSFGALVFAPFMLRFALHRFVHHLCHAATLIGCGVTHTHTDTHTHRHTDTHTHAHTHTRTYTHTHTHTHTHARTHTHTHTHARTHTSHHVVANALHAALTSGCCLLRLPPSPSASWLCPTLPSLRSQGLC